MDGIPNVTARRYGLSVTMPMSDAVEEFKVSTTMFDASLGRSNAGAMSVTTRSGSNSVTGSVYYYARDASLNANSWVNNKSGLPRPEGAKYHVASNTPYARYFLAGILEFQFYRAMCQASGYTGPLHRCSFYGSREAGRRLDAMLRMGASRPWPEALEALTGSRRIDAGAMLEYFAPLQAWLDRQNAGQPVGW